MSAMASRITSLTIVYSSVHSGTDQGKHQSSAPLAFVRGIHRWPVNFVSHSWCRYQMETFSALLALCEENSPVTDEFPAPRASNAENVSIWWHHHEYDTKMHEWFIESPRPGKILSFSNILPITQNCFMRRIGGFGQKNITRINDCQDLDGSTRSNWRRHRVKIVIQNHW